MVDSGPARGTAGPRHRLRVPGNPAVLPGITHPAPSRPVHLLPQFLARRSRPAAVFLLALALAAPLRAQMLDLNANGMSDVWEWLYNANGVNPNTDSDDDGFSNLQEARAGTNPFDASSYPRIPTVAYSAGRVSVTLPCALGKQYQLQSIATLTNTDWLVETNLVARSGTNVTLSAPAMADMRFYRVAISDVDSAGSGMNDWEKYQLGLDPSNPFSNGQQDANGNALSDYAYATNLLASQNVITLAATISTASQPDPGQTSKTPGQFTVTRGGFPLNALTVNLGLGGSGVGYAAVGVDYTALPAFVILAAGVRTQPITLTPLANTNLAAPVLAQLNLLPGLNYTIGIQSNASVVIYPSPPKV